MGGSSIGDGEIGKIAGGSTGCVCCNNLCSDNVQEGVCDTN